LIPHSLDDLPANGALRQMAVVPGITLEDVFEVILDELMHNHFPQEALNS
jgi:hypothetical protein